MTHIYEWFSFPDTISVVCPNCGSECSFQENKTVVLPNGIAIKKRPPRSKESSGLIEGKVTCNNCGFTKEQQIKWPEGAYWKFDIKGKVLWAWSIKHAKAILDYISSDQRTEVPGFKAALFHLPKHFKLAKNRDTVVRKISKAIREHQRELR